MYRIFTTLLFVLSSFFLFGTTEQRKPEIVGQHDVRLPEDNSREIVIADLIIEMEDTDADGGSDDDDDDDEDDDDGEDNEDNLKLKVEDGDHYSRSGNTITPNLNFAGILSVPVKVDNKGESSNTYTMQVEVVEENDAPVITSQATLQTPEEQAITITLSDLVVEDPDNIYPDDFTLTVYTGTNYTLSGATIQPNPDFYGTLSVPVTVSDGTNTSNTFDVQIDVTNVNDAPSITGQQQLTINEGQSLEIVLSHLTVSDVDDSYPDGFTLALSTGTNYTLSGNTVIPDANFSGTLTVPVTVNDGAATSNTFNLSVTVNAVNDAPVITGQTSLSTNEDNSLTIELSHLSVSDADNTYPDGFTLTVLSGSNYSVSGNTITPATNFSGELSVPVTVNDGTSSSDQFSMQVTVNAVNDAPVITGQAALETPENQPITIDLTNLTVTDVDNTYPTGFTLTVYGGSNYSFSGTTITPAQNFNGTLSVPVTVSDGSASSNSFQLQITVTSVNSVPVITSQTSLQTNEDQAITLSLSNLTVTDADNAYPTGFTMTAYAGSNYSLSGLTVTPTSNFSGTLTVPVTVNDGTSESATFNLQITVVAQNDAPSITGQNALATNEDTPLTIQLLDLQVSDVDNTFPTGFVLSVSAGDNYTVQGTTITPIANFNGTLSVPVSVTDGLLSSESFTLSVTVSPVNDAPVITAQQTLSTNEDTPITIALSHLTVTDIDNAYPTGFTLAVSSGENFRVSGTTVTPIADFSGNLIVPVTVSDGTASSATFNLTISVLPTNDAPVITGQVPLSTNEETPITIELSHLVVTDTDNTYPTGFTLVIGAGENYTVEGNVITPAVDFMGDLSVPVMVNDGTSSSNTIILMISVVGSNDVPAITAQTTATINEDSRYTFQLSNLTVTDTDHSYPTGFTFSLSAGDYYTVEGSDVVPEENFNGTLTVPVVVNDGINNSNTFNFTITVSPVNDAPVIVSHKPLSVYRNKMITIDLSHLQVNDPDNTYPEGFSLAVSDGENYTVSNNIVTPATDFLGMLSVPVTVNDGSMTSETFNIEVEVITPPNVKPDIVSQIALTTYENQPLAIELSHLIVVDPDNRFPEDFKLNLDAGDHYSLDGNKVVPETDYSGKLMVPVTVSDFESTSDVFMLTINVLPIADVPLITSQTFLRLNEDDSLTLKFDDLVVLDPDNTYPEGFTLTALDGEHYSLKGLQVKPDANYNGYLSVPVTVNDGANTSTPYQLLILVDPINDAPVITDAAESETMFYAMGKDPLKLFEKISVADVDDDSLAFAEISLSAGSYQNGLDSLSVTTSENIRIAFDSGSGLLLLFGKASVAAYQSVIQSLMYEYNGQRKNLTADTKVLELKLSDGKNVSEAKGRTISFASQSMTLDIPTGFTPNGDGANDTWNIKGMEGNETFSNAVVRVYNKQGSLVFETKGFSVEWDGKMNGVLLPADVYFYTIDLNAADVKNQYKGIVTILR